MQKILISACLLGEHVRYDGGNCLQQSQLLWKWQEEGRLVALCPEVAGGLPVPRPPAEIQPDGRIITIEEREVTAAFRLGAEKALQLCKAHGITVAILKEGSPSCGSSKINDGTFSSTKVAGSGVTAQLLRENGIRVFSELELDQVATLLKD